MNVLANLKGSARRWNQIFGGLSNFTQIFEARVLETPILSQRLVQNKQRNNCEATKMMARKIHVCIKNWEFHP